VLLIIGVVGCGGPDGIRMVLRNVGDVPLDSIVVHTTGRQYQAGRVASGDSTQLLIGANGESHIEIEHGIRTRQRLRVGTYFESGYGGKIEVHLRGDSVMTVIDSITI
jgi:hypothetical protein